MPEKRKNLETDENYFLAFGKELENKEELKQCLTALKCPPRYEQLHFWPDDLLSTEVKEEQINLAHKEILEAIRIRPERIEKILAPTKKQLKTWSKRRTKNVIEIAEKAAEKSDAFRYLNENNASSAMLLVRIDNVIDLNRKIRQKIEDLLSEKATRKQTQILQDSLDIPVPAGGDIELADEDKGRLPDILKGSEVIVKPAERVYYPSQIFLANQIVERIKVIYSHYHGGKTLSSFEKFDFCIYTANINMLRDQTCSRLSNKDYGCFPDSLYEGSDIKAREKAREKVFKYDQKTVDEQYVELCRRVGEEPNTLFLIVADEAHWGATKGDKANSTLINNWNTKKHPNVILLQVTATPYNLLTDNTRLPTAYYRCGNNSDYEVKMEKDTNDQNFELLHRVKWTDSFKFKVQKGIVVKLRVPLRGFDKSPAQLYIQPPNTTDDFLPWYGLMLTKTYPNYISEFLMQGDENQVTISTIDGEWILVVRDKEVGFICKNKKVKGISSFGILDGYGEGLMLLKFAGNDGRENHLAYNETNKMIEPHLRRIRFRNSDYEVPPYMDSSFLTEQCRPLQSLGPVKEYLSLTYYFNSMRNEDENDQLIREDKYFDNMVQHIITHSTKMLKIEDDDILIAEYSYYIILINLQRKCPLKITSINQCFENLAKCAGDYPKRREIYISEFKEEIRKQRSMNIHPIDPEAFERILSFLSVKVLKDFKKDLKAFFESPTHKMKAEELMQSIVACLLHLNIEQLKCIEKDLNINKVKTGLIEIYTPEDLKFEDRIKKVLLESETGRIVDNLIPNDIKKLNGTMNILRTNKTDSGNKMYKTLCIARKISSDVDYSFEILRDYSTANLSDDFDDKLEPDQIERTARYRIRERMQPKKCSHIDPQTFASCSICVFKSNERNELLPPTMECKRCRHVHKRIENYEDLEGLPCILILVQRGRLGDTFPQSLRALDSRLCHTKKMGSITLASIVQEMGRLCRYQVKSDKNLLPYTLIGKHLADTLKRALHVGVPFHSMLELPDNPVQLDRKTTYKKRKNRDLLYDERENMSRMIHVANKNHYDHGNTEKHYNRILLGAEPQIGKTGVYLKVISLLHKKISPDSLEESEDEDEEDIADETEEDVEERNDKSSWVYPFWKYNEEGSKLSKTVSHGKYCRLYGTYKHGNPAPEILPRTIFNKRTTKEKKNTIKECEIDERKSHSFREHSSCIECSVQYENEELELYLPNSISELEEKIRFRISVPKTLQYQELLQCIMPYATSTLPYLFPMKRLPDAQRLNKWIFIPSYKRSARANINLYHTMVTEESGQQKPCHYTTVLVVRSTDFESYRKLWQSTHAILQIPDTLPRADRDAEEGGIGFARLSIQIFAESLQLDWIFMLDDNMPYVYEIEESDSAVKRENGNLTETKVSLFKVLKHIEKQVDGSVEKAPKEDFEKYTEKYPKVNNANPLEEYTGINNNYGIIGVKKHRPTSRKVGVPFKKTHVHSLVFLNINMLKEKNIYYKPWAVFEDLNINNDCDDKGLWICKYNRFTVWKQNMKTWIPHVYIWNENTELRKVKDDAQNSTDILISYLRCKYTIKDIIELSNSMAEEDDVEFELFLQDVPKPTGKHTLLAIWNRDFEKSTEILQDIFKQKDIPYFTNGQNHLIIMMSTDSCIEVGLTKKVVIEDWLKRIFDKKFEFEVVTSHNVGSFNVKILLVIVKVYVQSHRADPKKMQPLRLTTGKKRPSDEYEERDNKTMKLSDDGENSEGKQHDDLQQMRDEGHKWVDEMDPEILREFLDMKGRKLKIG